VKAAGVEVVYVAVEFPELVAIYELVGTALLSITLLELAAAELLGALVVGAALELLDALTEAVILAGMLIGTPADWHVDWTSCRTVAWSAASQAFCTQGVMVPIKVVLAQWQAKSVRELQPSEERAVTKHESAQLGMFGNV